MDFTGSLDLCLSCGNHVADGTAYCSTRCLSLDRSARRNLACPSSSISHMRLPSTSSLPRQRSSSSSRRQQHQQQAGPSAASSSDDEESILYFDDIVEADPSQVQKLASVAEWAEGVWGGMPSHADRQPLKMERRIVPVPVAIQSSSKSAHSSSRSPKPSSRRPNFTLSIAHVAPPAMSITTSRDSDASSVITPSSSAGQASPRMTIQHRRKSSNGEAMDPFIASPPYEFAYNMVKNARGRALTRA